MLLRAWWRKHVACRSFKSNKLVAVTAQVSHHTRARALSAQPLLDALAEIGDAQVGLRMFGPVLAMPAWFIACGARPLHAAACLEPGPVYGSAPLAAGPYVQVVVQKRERAALSCLSVACL